MQDRAREIAQRIRASGFVRIITHIDSDGLGAGAVAKISLERLGIGSELRFMKSLGPGQVQGLVQDLPENGLVWFCDLGAGVLPELEGAPSIVTDHHKPRQPLVDVPPNKRGDLLAFAQEVESAGSTVLQLNPHEFGIDGSSQISGAGVTYLVARELDPGNIDLSVLAVVGAVGDIQTPGNRLVGLNREILDCAVAAGLMSVETDIAYYGRETRDIVQLLSHASEPPIPTLAREPGRVADLIEYLGIPLHDDRGGIRHWTDLDQGEKEILVSAVMKLFLMYAPDPRLAGRIVGEVYVVTGEKKGSPLRDAREYSTLLNACGRYGHYDTALRILQGDRGVHLEKGLELMWEHRSNIMRFIEVVKEAGIVNRKGFEYFDAGGSIPEEVVGIILGIVMTNGMVDRSRPVFAFADSSSDPEMVKVSARASRTLVDQGLDLSRLLKNCAAGVGGSGGGHEVAAGGTIPRSRLEEFLVLLEDELD